MQEQGYPERSQDHFPQGQYRSFPGRDFLDAQIIELECGCLMEKRPELDAISLGPDCWDLHSPQERLSVSSTLRMYEFLEKLLAEIQ